MDIQAPYDEDLAQIAKALGHPTRLAILRFLAAQSSCYFGEIHEELPQEIAKSSVSQHLKMLKEVGLIQGQVEPPKVRYCINPQRWEQAQELFTLFLSQGKSFKNSCCED